MAKLVVISKAQAGLSYELGQHWVTIGRNPGNVFQIVESSVSGQHCEVSLRGEELVVRDMRSTNGTFIKGRMITEGILRIGEVLRLGEVDLRLEPSNPKVMAPAVSPATDRMAKSALTSPIPPAGFVGGKKHQVLLVDDSMAFLEMAGELFEVFAGGGWEIHRTSGADQALNIIQQHQIELAVLDLNMPMLDGVQLLGIIHRRHPEVKKVVLTGVANETNRAQCLATGAELFLEKPLTPDGMRFVFNILTDLMAWNQREGFSGALRQVGLTDIIQIECLRRSSCILEIHTPQAQGEIYIESGVIVHAVAGEVSGGTALHRLLSLNNGEFHLHPFRRPLERTIQGSWEWLLLESARVHDEEKIARASDDTVVLTKPKAEASAGTSENSPGPPRPADQKGKTPAPGQDTSFLELGSDIVVVSTYDGKWNPADGKKP
jgi:CheY-like chemotaxis protein